MDGIRRRYRICKPSSPNLWSPPPDQVFKLKFDGACQGNPEAAGYGGVFQDHNGRIITMYMGEIGIDTNNSAELECMIQGFQCLVREGRIPVIIEGDTHILIEKTKRMVSGKTCEKVSYRWRLASHLDTL